MKPKPGTSAASLAPASQWTPGSRGERHGRGVVGGPSLRVNPSPSTPDPSVHSSAESSGTSHVASADGSSNASQVCSSCDLVAGRNAQRRNNFFDTGMGGDGETQPTT